MAVGIEDILLLKAQQDAENQLSPGTAGSIGAGVGATAGISIGQLANRLRPQTVQSATAPSLGARLKPGPRMAGGLVGLVLGGGLGVGARQMAIENSPAAELLAKLQVQGSLSPSEQNTLQSILADSYSSQIGMA